MIRVITTFSRKQWDDYVHKLLPRSIELWPEEIEWQVWLDNQYDPVFLHRCVYSNGRTIPDIRYLSDDPEHEAFMSAWKERVAKDPKLQASLTKFRYPFGYTQDAGTFAHKVFAFTSKEARDGADWLIFLGSDVETLKPVTREWLDAVLFGGDVLHLGRHDIRSSETDFLAFRYPAILRDFKPIRSTAFLAALRHIYTSGDIFNYAEWIDGHIIGRLCAVFTGMGIDVVNLSDGIPGLDVFEKTVLGERLCHHKGPRGKTMLIEKLKT